MNQFVNLKLGRDEALVLFEWLSRQEDTLPAEPGQRVALWSLEGALEEVLAEPFDEHYVELVRAAEARLAERGFGTEPREGEAGK